ncbi:hypothetical protein COW46_00075 [Candidatus Gracilibacteria bacterium CG17_big_fil_post_rev_8_21_14_2_50_48_13]|nr:MAG: hypothetical protein COW46_00075 [Candidatus Gracilibacteria bacterium CG17_big_fil_post_rev_8_21_14_2_50_48_13]
MASSIRGAFSARFLLRASLAVLLIATGLLGYVYYQANSYEQPIPGGTFREGIVGNISTINPLFAQLNPAEPDVVALVYSGLTKYDPKQKKIVPDLATFQASNDYKEFVFRLHPDAKWHDGTPVTADDVVFTYSLLMDPEFSNALLKSAFEGVKVTKVDEKTVQFKLPTSYVFFPTATMLGILPKHIWEKVPVAKMKSDPAGLKPIGSGPFKIEEGFSSNADGAQIVTLVRNDEYYAATPYLDRIILQFYPTFEQVLANKTSLVAMKRVPFENQADVQAMQRFDLYEIDEPRYYAAYLNVENETLVNVKTRMGLSLAVNREELISPYPFLREVNSPFPDSNDDSWKTQYFPDRAQGSLFDAGWKMPTDEQVAAKKVGLWKQYLSGTTMREGRTSGSGVTLESGSGSSLPEIKADEVTEEMTKEAVLDGRLVYDILAEYKRYRVNAKGETFVLRMVTLSSPSYLTETTRRIAEAWNNIGVKTEVSEVEPDELRSIVKSRDYDVMIIGQDLGYDADIFPYWHSSAAKLSGLNLSNFKNSTLDKILESMRKPSADLTEDELMKNRQSQIEQIASLLHEEIPAIFLFQQKNYFAVDKKIKNVYIQNLVTPKDRFAYADTWYESSGKQLRDVSVQNFMQWLGSMLAF